MREKKKYTKLITILALFIGIGLVLVINEERIEPKDEPFQKINQVVTNQADDVVMVTRAKQMLKRLNADDSLRFRNELEQVPEQGLATYSDIAVDQHGVTYALITQLDSFGLRAIAEKIVMYDDDVDDERILYEKEHHSQNDYFQIGTVRSLQVVNDQLYFYVYEHPRLKLYQYLPEEGTSEILREVQLPADIFLNEITGVHEDRTFFSTKKGEIYRLNMQASPMHPQVTGPLYVHHEQSYLNKTVPTHLQTDTQGRLYFFNEDQNQIERLDTSNPATVEVVITPEQMEQAGMTDGTSLTSFGLNPDGDMVLASDRQLVFLDATTKNTRLLTAPLTSEMDQWLFRLWWIGFGFDLVLLVMLSILLFRLFRLPLILKQILVILPLIYVPIYLQMESRALTFHFIELENQTDLRLQTYVSAQLLNGDLINRIQSSGDYMSEAYRQLRTNMDTLKVPGDEEVNRGLYRTLYKIESGQVSIIMDDDDELHMFDRLPFDQDFKQVVEQKEVTSATMMDRSGYWVYAMAPIYDSNNQIVGVLELGREMNGIKMQHNEMSRQLSKDVAMVWIVCALLFFLFSWFTYRNIRKLQMSVERMGRGDYDVVAKVRTMDEIQRLAEHFNAMTAKIRQYIANMKRMNEANDRFVPQQFIQYLGKESILDVELGDQVEQEMAIMRMSMPDFYNMSQRLPSEETFQFINAFLKRFAPVVTNHRGMIVEYLDPGVLALYPKGVDDALLAAIEMRQALEIYNERRAAKGKAGIDIQIGLHYGSFLLGIIGEETRLEANVISDHVHMVGTLEEMTKMLGSRILASEAMMQRVRDRNVYQYRDLGWILLPGKHIPYRLYDVYQGDPEEIRLQKEATKEMFEQAVMMYQNGRFHDARAAFLQVIKQNRWDQAARLYFYMCDEYAQQGVEEKWSGELRITG